MIKLAISELCVEGNTELMQAVLNEVGACIYIKDLDGCYRYTNIQTQRMFQRSAAELKGRHDSDFFDRISIGQVCENDRKVLKTGMTVQAEEILTLPTGHIHTYQVVKSPIVNPDNDVIGLFGVSTDITELHKLKEELRVQATTDVLTGVFNRRCFFEVAEREFSKTRRHNLPLSLIVLDLDHFKQVNDVHGHLVGDEVLAFVARFVEQMLRREDIVARIGGEEFAVLLPNTGHEAALDLAERIRTQLGEQALSGVWDGAVRITASMGVASQQSEDCAFNKLYMRADVALYQAKHSGRNQVCSG